jgi:hypothetical protein
VPAFVQSESFAPCFGDSPPGAVSVEKLREVRLAASRGNRVQMKLTSTGFRAVRRGPAPELPYRPLAYPYCSPKLPVFERTSEPAILRGGDHSIDIYWQDQTCAQIREALEFFLTTASYNCS